jgi:hypothetical protein
MPSQIYKFLLAIVVEIDCGSLVNERQGTEAYRLNTISYLKYCFEPETCGYVDPVVGLHNSECFYSIGKNLQSGQSRGEFPIKFLIED